LSIRGVGWLLGTLFNLRVSLEGAVAFTVTAFE
jgi:hypothetical protein